MKLGKCEHDGCDSKDTALWTIYGMADNPEFVLCTPHAIEFGFCPNCGAFIGGTEETFLTDGKLCIECYTAERREYERSLDTGDDDDYEDYSL